MPPAAGAIIGAAVSTAIGGALTIGATTFSLFSSFLIRAAVGLALHALSPKPKGSGGLRQGTLITQYGSATDRQIIYGRVRVGGSRLYDEATGSKNKFLHRIIGFTGHEIESFDEIWIDDYKVTLDGSGFVTSALKNDGESTTRFGAVRIKQHLGADDQLADSDLVSESNHWTSSHRLRGIAYLYVRLEYDADNFPNGVPAITATIKGKKVYDPRDGGQSMSDPSTWLWSSNPALCLRDYISTSVGLDESDTSIDDTLVTTAANACDVQINGLNKFTCNGAFFTSSAPREVILGLLSSMAGVTWYAQGKWRMKAGAWTAATHVFDESDLRGSIKVATRHTRRENFNTVKGTFRGAETDWQPTDYPEVSNAAFVSADNNQVSIMDMKLGFTDTSIIARRIARIALERNRQQLAVQSMFGSRALKVQIGDNIKLTNSRFGWTEKEFEVVDWRLGLIDQTEIQIAMVLREITSSVFDEVSDGIVYERDNTTLPDPFFVPVVGLSVTSNLREFREKVVNELRVTTTSGSQSFVDKVELEYKLAADVDYIRAGTGELGLFIIQDLEDDTYDVRARAVNYFGLRGDWTTHRVALDALSQPPADVTNFTAEVNGAIINLSWHAVADIDLSHYVIRYSPLTSNATWADSVTYTEKVPRPAVSVSVPARAGTFLIRAVDKSAVQSENASSVVVLSADLEQFTTTITQSEDPVFSGTKNGCAVVGVELRMADQDLFDSLTGNVDDFVGLWDELGVQYTGTSATYDFNTHIDVGSVKRCRIRVDAYSERFDSTGSLFDDLIGLIDSLPGLWDELTSNPQFDDTDIVAYVSTTNDDPAGSPSWSPYRVVRVADISARAFRFRIAMMSDTNELTPSIAQLDAVVQHD